VRFDPKAGRVVGSEAHILPDARPLMPTGGRESNVSFSDAGPLAYVASESSFYNPYTRLAWVDRDGHVEPLPFEGHHYYNSLDLSPDGRKAAVTLMSEGQFQVWVYDLERGTREQLTRGGLNLEPNWSPDGTSIAVTGQFRGNYDIRIWKAEGPATPTVELSGPLDESNWRFVPGTARGVYVRGSVETGNDLWSREVGVEGSDRVLFASPFDENDPQPSRDGQFIAYTSQSKLYVMRADGAGERSQVATGATFSEWSAVSGELFIMKGGKIVAVPYDVVGGAFRPRSPRELVEPPRTPIEMTFAASPDARRFLVFVPVPGKTRDPEVRVLTDGFGLLSRALDAGGRE
jgi:dipeptidyl aminopeptidase/acylaminoacyl peptidase